MGKINEDDFTKEKNMWEVFQLTRKITLSKSHVYIMLISAALLGCNSIFVICNTSSIANEIREWALIGFNFSIATIGPLIAGFTIFATLSKPDMMIAMMGHINKKTEMPTLKYNFMAFMKVFIAFITLMFLYFGIMIFGQSHGLIVRLLNLLPHAENIKIFLVNIAYILTGTSLIYLLLTLKTFIFNIYAIVMNSIRWEYTLKQNAKEDNPPKPNCEKQD